MSTQEVRPSSKWSAIRSKAVPSNVIPPASDASVRALNAGQMVAEKINATGTLNQVGKSLRAKAVLPHRQNRPVTFAGSTGQPQQ